MWYCQPMLFRWCKNIWKIVRALEIGLTEDCINTHIHCPKCSTCYEAYKQIMFWEHPRIVHRKSAEMFSSSISLLILDLPFSISLFVKQICDPFVYKRRSSRVCVCTCAVSKSHTHPNHTAISFSIWIFGHSQIYGLKRWARNKWASLLLASQQSLKWAIRCVYDTCIDDTHTSHTFMFHLPQIIQQNYCTRTDSSGIWARNYDRQKHLENETMPSK